MYKKIRKGVRTFLIKDDKILITKYKTQKNLNYYDVPGGKIEENEKSEDASIREFKEETGINVITQKYKGNVIIEYPSIIFNFDIYEVEEFSGIPLEFEENYSMWINIEELLNNDRIFPCIEIIKYINSDNIKLKIESDEKHNIIKVE